MAAEAVEKHMCLTCGVETYNPAAIGCGHWSWCPNYANAKANNTLPIDWEKYTGG